MEPTSVPIELISFRGLLKSFEDIANGNFMNNRDNQHGKKNGNVFKAVKNLFVYSIFQVMQIFENILFILVSQFDYRINGPLKRYLKTNMEEHLQSSVRMFFNLNYLLIFRILLFIPVSLCLKLNLNKLACIVFSFQSVLSLLSSLCSSYSNPSNTQLDCLLIRFCNKLIHVITLLAILQTANFEQLQVHLVVCFYVISYSVVFYNIWIGARYIDDYFEMKYKRLSEKDSRTAEAQIKRKLEPIGIASLCLAIDPSYDPSLLNGWSMFGLFCLLITIRMAHKGFIQTINADLKIKLKNKKILEESFESKIESQDSTLVKYRRSKSASFVLKDEFKTNDVNKTDLIDDSCPKFWLPSDDETEIEEAGFLSKEIQTDIMEIRDIFDSRVDTIYTIGCFDLFHDGHVKLLERMRTFGRKLIVGVHDSRSIYKLKQRVPVDSTEKRMLNVKKHADVVFCIPATDPSEYMRCIIHVDKSENALYVRGDDMPNFPSRHIVEQFMPIKLISYTQGVSSTQLRNSKFSHIKANDEEYLENNC